MPVLKSIFTAVCLIGCVLSLRAEPVASSASAKTDVFSDDPRLHGTWHQNREATVSNAFHNNPGLANATPEQIERFKNLFGHSTLIMLNGLMTVRVGTDDLTFHYQVMERGTNYVIIHNDDPLQKGHDMRIHFLDDGKSFGIVNQGGYEVQFDRISSAETPAVYRAPLYDESADGSKQIADALATSKKEGKRVLLQFGANWCGWCRLLHKLFETDKDIAQELDKSYVIVMVDVNQKHNQEVNAKYGNPTRHGLPVIVILDNDGKQLATKDTGELEEGDHHNPARVLAFLKEWSPKK